MTNNQLLHYINGGKFKAIYNPKSLDISRESLIMIGKTIIVYQNMLIGPIAYPDKCKNQFRFNSESIYGWFPEEDIEIVEEIQEYVEYIEKLPKFLYRFHYTEQSQLSNFGNNHNFTAPMIVDREYSIENDQYVLSLSNPQATYIEKAEWNGENVESIKWETLVNNK